MVAKGAKWLFEKFMDGVCAVFTAGGGWGTIDKLSLSMVKEGIALVVIIGLVCEFLWAIL
jgi:hypothetical protein